MTKDLLSEEEALDNFFRVMDEEFWALPDREIIRQTRDRYGDEKVIAEKINRAMLGNLTCPIPSKERKSWNTKYFLSQIFSSLSLCGSRAFDYGWRPSLAALTIAAFFGSMNVSLNTAENTHPALPRHADQSTPDRYAVTDHSAQPPQDHSRKEAKLSTTAGAIFEFASAASSIATKDASDFSSTPLFLDPSVRHVGITPNDITLIEGKNALQKLREDAERGNASALSRLGAAYERGLAGAPKNINEAIIFYRHASEMGDLYAQVRLAFLYEKVGNSKAARAEAGRLYTQAAKQGNTYALSRLIALSSEPRSEEHVKKEMSPARRRVPADGGASAMAAQRPLPPARAAPAVAAAPMRRASPPIPMPPPAIASASAERAFAHW